jgi:hypothetical protein
MILSSKKQDLKASVLGACCTYFLYLSIGLHVSMLCQNCWESYVSYLPYIILVTLDWVEH